MCLRAPSPRSAHRAHPTRRHLHRRSVRRRRRRRSMPSFTASRKPFLKPGHMLEDGNGFSMRCAAQGARPSASSKTDGRESSARRRRVTPRAREVGGGTKTRCIRDIAMHALVRELLPFDKNPARRTARCTRSIRSSYRSILASAMNRLAKDGAPLDPIVVAGLLTSRSPTPTSRPSSPAKCAWEENRGERSLEASSCSPSSRRSSRSPRSTCPRILRSPTRRGRCRSPA